MAEQVDDQIARALGADLPAPPPVVLIEPATLPSYFDTTGLATASVRAAAAELAAWRGARGAEVSQRRALMWFNMTLRPQGWALPGLWDVVAGDYPCADGWVRLHTNAPHHRAAALSVLGCAPDRAAVAEAVAGWGKTALETAIVGAGGCAAAMHSLADWADHPQGRAVAAAPLIAWEVAGEGPKTGGGRLRVLDLTRVLAGPVATRFLAGFGAEVLRIDPPGWDEPGVIPEVSVGKRRATLDLRRSEDRATFTELLRGADVLVHGYRPGALAGLGFDRAARRALNPGLIDVSLCAYGWQGPWAERRGFDSLVQMSCGIADAGMRLAGAAKPVPLPVQALDHGTGYLMAAAVLRALRLRAATGQAMAARLSLARTAALLVGQGTRACDGAAPVETDADLAPEIAHTGWGPARRVAFPVTLDGAGPRWPVPAGPLHSHPARWA